MKPNSALLALATLTLTGLMVTGSAPAQTRNEGPLVLVCVSAEESRELFVADKLVSPLRVMREASRVLQAEAIDIQLCRAEAVLVYDVTLLDRDGRVVHRLVLATNGSPFNPRGQP